MFLTFYFNEAQTAGSRWLRVILEGTQVGDIDTVVQRYPKELLLLTGGYFVAINGLI